MIMNVNNVSKMFNNKKVLNNISFQCQDGETVVITGESGKGKTTLIKIITGLVKPDTGSVEFDIDKKQIKCGYVFQENRLSESFNAIENVKMILNDKAYTKDDIIKGLSILLPEDELEKPVRDFSGGMKRRLCIVMAVMSNPNYFVMDEPFAGLDENTTKKVVEYIKEKTKGKLLILAIHKNEYFEDCKEIVV
ncbi:MAG: ABC transporter ATP-binding protein [Clostridia bacterium]|nr:ABC transporter ATP-binding protein [Clostridia bacterium]